MGLQAAPAWLRRTALVIVALEAAALGGAIALILLEMGNDPLGKAIATGLASVLGLFLLLCPLPALALAWRGRFVRTALALAACGPLALMWVWARL